MTFQAPANEVFDNMNDDEFDAFWDAAFEAAAETAVWENDFEAVSNAQVAAQAHRFQD